MRSREAVAANATAAWRPVSSVPVSANMVIARLVSPPPPAGSARPSSQSPASSIAAPAFTSAATCVRRVTRSPGSRPDRFVRTGPPSSTDHLPTVIDPQRSPERLRPGGGGAELEVLGDPPGDLNVEPWAERAKLPFEPRALPFRNAASVGPWRFLVAGDSSAQVAAALPRAATRMKSRSVSAGPTSSTVVVPVFVVTVAVSGVVAASSRRCRRSPRRGRR